MANVKIKTRTVGQNFGTVGVVTDTSTGAVLHETETKPLSFSGAAIDAAEAWATEHDHETMEMAVDRLAAHSLRYTGRTGVSQAALRAEGWDGQAIGFAIKTGSLVAIQGDRLVRS